MLHPRAWTVSQKLLLHSTLGFSGNSLFHACQGSGRCIAPAPSLLVSPEPLHCPKCGSPRVLTGASPRHTAHLKAAVEVQMVLAAARDTCTHAVGSAAEGLLQE